MWTDFYSLSNAVQALLAGGVVGVLLGQHRIYRRPALRLWALGWAASALGLFAGAIGARLWASLGAGSIVGLALLAISSAGAALQAGALLAGALVHAGRPPAQRSITAALVLCAVAGAILSFASPGTQLGNVRAGVLPLLTSVAFLSSAALLWQARGPTDVAGALAPPVLAAYGLVRLAYPVLLLLSKTKDAQAWEPGALRELVVVDSLLQSAVNFAMLLWLLREEHLRVETVSGELRRVAMTDALTRLPNRTAFVLALTAALPKAESEQRSMAVCLLDLDRFKALNDSLGPAHGDELLREVARRLRAALPARAGLARLGNDDFAVLLPDPGPPAQLEDVAARLLAAVRGPITLGAHEVRMTASIGIALYPAHALIADDLLSDAALANSRASADGGDREQLYAPSLGAEARGQISVTLALRRALEDNQFVLYFQPIAALETGRVEGFEALIRWQQPGGPLVPPGEFLPLVLAAGVADDLDDFVLRAATAKAVELRALEPNLRMAVNLSARFFHLPHPVQRVKAALDKSGLPAEALELEITETAAMRDAEATLAVLGELKQLGVRLAIDDFGTGYSSLSYLRRFPVDALKIDQSFVKSLDTDPNALAIVQGILALARSLRLLVVAEGIETRAQLSRLEELGCDLLQGFAIGRPLPATRAAEALGRPAIFGGKERAS